MNVGYFKIKSRLARSQVDLFFRMNGTTIGYYNYITLTCPMQYLYVALAIGGMYVQKRRQPLNITGVRLSSAISSPPPSGNWTRMFHINLR